MLFAPEKAILVGVQLTETKHIPLEESMQELTRLAETAGAEVVGQLTKNRPKPDLKYFIGSGKLDEIKAAIAAYNANMVILDNNISAAQNRNLLRSLEVKVVDRTEIILDIFAQHASSHEGKLQVELAQSSFLLTRLIGHGVAMSRLGGGIGTRGPGETKLEQDRRYIRKRISELKKEIEKLRKERSVRRDKRRKSNIPTIAIVGYTNSGKSTLLNALAKSDVLTQDQLFATLDPTVRRVTLPNHKIVLMSDTVGFIQKLPHQLIAAFRATLEEVSEADLLLHVVDASHPYREDQINAVLTVLEELKCGTKPMITVFNKSDKLTRKISGELLKKHEPSVVISALHQSGLDKLVTIFFQLLRQPA